MMCRLSQVVLSLFLLAFAPLQAADHVAVLQSGSQPGPYLVWKGESRLLIGDSVTQGWMESGENFDQRGYVDALAARGINLLMLWAFKGPALNCSERMPASGTTRPSCGLGPVRRMNAVLICAS